MSSGMNADHEVVDGDAIVLAIAEDDGLMHVGPGFAVLDHIRLGTEPPPADLEFYDESGRRLTVVGADLVVDPSATPPDETLLLDRIDVVQARMQVALDRQPLIPDTPGDRVITRLPRVTGELPEVLQVLAFLNGDLPAKDDPDSGPPWHMVAHLLKIAH